MALLALYQTVKRLEHLPLHMKLSFRKRNCVEWMLIKDHHNSTSKEARHCDGTFKIFHCQQHNFHQWDAVMRQIADGILQEVFAWEVVLLQNNKTGILV
jgi:hypothetical protein